VLRVQPGATHRLHVQAADQPIVDEVARRGLHGTQPTVRRALDSTPVSSNTGEDREEGHMHARLSRFAGLDPERIEETTRQFEDESLEALAQQPGFRGITVGVNRRSGKAVTLTLWETEADMRQSAKLADEARQQAVATAKPERDPIVDDYEVLVSR
jgi:heme-degrading monooxygenase HmoA